MDKLSGFFCSMFKNKGLSLESIGGIQGLLDQISKLSNNGSVDLNVLKKLVMPYAANFLPGSVKDFFKTNKDKKEMPVDDVMSFFQSNMKEDAPATKKETPAQMAETQAS